MSDFLEIKWAKTHNLRNISVDIPKNKLVVVTWVSWSWKSSFAFDTIYAEWQRRYLESLSTYARMIISWINEDTKVDEIRWLSPTISINQKTVSSNPRSTVWTITEIYDFYRLLYLNTWIQKCPNHNDIILKKDTLRDIIDFILKMWNGDKFYILSPLKKKFNKISELKKDVLDRWFIRFSVNDEIYSVWDDNDWKIEPDSDLYIVIDRLVKEDFNENPNLETRIKDSIEMAYKQWDWMLVIQNISKPKKTLFSKEAFCPKCFYSQKDLSLSNFSFNSHYWACQSCHWLWAKIAFLEENIINFKLTLDEGAILPWNQHKYYIAILWAVCKKYWIDTKIPYFKLKNSDRNIILHWLWDEQFEIPFTFEDWTKRMFKTKYEWVMPNLERKYKETDLKNEMSLKRLSQYMTEITCPDCDGYRLKKEYLSVYVWDKHIWELSDLNIRQSIEFFNNLEFSTEQKEISKNIFKNIKDRLEFLAWVWLDYITISRKANTLSWWESQRIRLATQIWTRLEGIIYVLDEPSIWLHPRDNSMLIWNLKKLSEIWNTVIVVEHDEDIMRESDYIIDIWPWAWIHWWEIVFKWTFDEILLPWSWETWEYLSNRKIVSIPKKWRKPKWYIEVIWAKENNLKWVDVKFPLWLLSVVTWVSGSWKSSLVMDILANYLLNELWSWSNKVWEYKEIKWHNNIDKVIIIDQSPIWRTPHSNVATYTWVFTHIREVFSKSTEAQKRWYWPWRFSFNTKWWRCEVCEWSWVKKIEMHFLPDVYVECESCQWTRYNPETLDVKYKWKNIAEVLNMDVEEALEFFLPYPKIHKILEVLSNVWLGYIKIWQSAPTLSWWESQRIKLSTELAKRSTTKTMYILDEPTTWLHFSDVQKLINILDSLVEKWNTVLVIEHNLDLIANSDYIIDIWPEWWDRWWELLFQWPLRKILDEKRSFTQAALKSYFKHKNLI